MAGPDLVENVARAICLSDGDDPDRLWNVEHPELRWLIYRENAQSAIVAVLDAIADPSEEMVCIGDEEIVQVLNAQSFLKALDEGTPALRCYRAMIAALRKEVG